MKKSIALLLLSSLLLCGCSKPTFGRTEEVETETEVPTPDIIADTNRQLSYQEITVGYTLSDNQAFGVDTTDAYWTIYPDKTQFRDCIVHVAYMPNFNWYKDLKDDVFYRDLGNGYTAYAVSDSMSADECNAVLNNIQVLNFTPN